MTKLIKIHSITWKYLMIKLLKASFLSTVKNNHFTKKETKNKNNNNQKKKKPQTNKKQKNKPTLKIVDLTAHAGVKCRMVAVRNCIAQEKWRHACSKILKTERRNNHHERLQDLVPLKDQINLIIILRAIIL